MAVSMSAEIEIKCDKCGDRLYKRLESEYDSVDFFYEFETLAEENDWELEGEAALCDGCKD